VAFRVAGDGDGPEARALTCVDQRGFTSAPFDLKGTFIKSCPVKSLPVCCSFGFGAAEPRPIRRAPPRRFAQLLRLCLNRCRFSTCRVNSSHASLIRANRLIPFCLIYQVMCIPLARITAFIRACIVATRLCNSSDDITSHAS
jgi:hypothetical protein